MTYTELLDEVKDIRKSLARLEGDTTLTDQAEALQEVFEKQEEYQKEIETLEEKLANPESNYALYATDTTKSRVADIEKHIANIDVEDARLEADIANANYRLQTIENDFMDYQNLIAIGEKEIADYEQANNEDKTAEEIIAIEDSIQKTRAAIEEIHTYMDALEQERTDLTSVINTTSNRKTQLAMSKDRYERLLEKGQTAIEKGFIIDRVSMREDQAKLEQYRQTLRAYDAKEAYLSFNCENELDSLEEDIHKENIDKEQVLDRLQTIREHAPYLPTDSTDEIKENQKTQQAYEARIEELQTKLGNNENYVISATSSEQLKREVQALETRKAAYEVREKENEAALVQKTRDKVNTLDEIDELQDTLQDLERTIASIETKLPDVQSKKARREYEIDLNACRKETTTTRKKLEELYVDSESLKTQVDMAKTEQKRISKLQTEIDKVLKLKRERLEDKKTMDVAAKNQDEEELKELSASLLALKSREEYLLFNTHDKIDQLIEKVKTQELISERKSIKETVVTFIEDTKKGLAVTFEKFNNTKLIQKIKSSTFKQKAIAGLTAAAIVLSAGVATLMSKSKIQKGDLSSQTHKAHEVDREKLQDHRLQINDKIFTYTDLEKNEDLINNKDNETIVEKEENHDTVEAKKSLEEVAKEVIRGTWGNGQERKEKLKEAGYSDEEIAQIQAQVNAFYNTRHEITTETKKDNGSTVIENQTKPEEQPVLPPEASAPGYIYVPQAPIEEPIQTPERPILHQPPVQGPIYTIDGDEEITDIEFHPIEITKPETPNPIPSEPESPKPETPSEKNTVSVTVKKGDTLVIDTEQGKVAVDNSDGKNYNDLEEGTSVDYTSNSAVDSVHYNDQDESVEVKVDKSEVTPTEVEQRELDQQILDDYEQILREMGISSNTLEDAGRTR